MDEYVSISSIQLPDALKPYQEAVDLIWTDNMRKEDVSSIATKLIEFVHNNILRKKFIKRMLLSALYAKVKNYNLVLSIASQVFELLAIKSHKLRDFDIIDPNPIIWNDDVDALVTKDLCENDIAEAARYGAVKCFKVLISKFSYFGEELCENAIIGGNLEIIRILDRHLNFATKRNVFVAISNHRNNILDWIIEKDPSLSKIESDTCLMFMNYQGLISQFPHFNLGGCVMKMRLIDTYPTSFFKALFDLGLDVDFVHQDVFERLTLLLFAAKSNNFEYVKFLLEQGADINKILFTGVFTRLTCSALMFAVEEDNVELAIYLLNHGADANIKYGSASCIRAGYASKSLLDIAKSQRMKNILKIHIKDAKFTEKEEEDNNDIDFEEW